LAGAAFLFLSALVFTGVFVWSPKSWWAIIPAGVFASLGLCAVLESVIPHRAYPDTLTWGVYIWVFFLGLAATFGVLWLLRKSRRTGWAKYPAIGLLALAVLAGILGSHFDEVWMATMILVTGGTLVLALFTRKAPDGKQAPAVKS
jgi:peptidoglycan/LPS O-acetylase OafA/YrhL